MTVFLWTAEGNLEDLELRFAPTWVILKNVPPQLYSLDGIGVVASAIGEPLHTEKSRLEPYHFGDTKVKVEIDLSVLPPDVVEVRDAENNSVRIKIEYPKLPPKCCNCGKFGHLMNRCPLPPMKRKTHHQHQPREKERVKVASAPPSVSVAEPQKIEDSTGNEVVPEDEVKAVVESGDSPGTQKRARSRSRTRAQRRSRSKYPAFRLRAVSCDEIGEVELEDVTGKVGMGSSEKKDLNSGKGDVGRRDLGEEAERFASLKAEEEEIWLLPKAAKRAQK